MQQVRLWQSVATRAVVALIAGGLLAAAGLGVVQWRQDRQLAGADLRQRMTTTARALQGRIEGLYGPVQGAAAQAVLAEAVADDPWLRAARLSGEGFGPVSAGDWSEAGPGLVGWDLPETGDPVGTPGTDRWTVVRAPFRRGHLGWELELLVDGPAVAAAVGRQVWVGLVPVWLTLAGLTLWGVLVLLRVLAGPLSRTAALAGSEAGSDAFRVLAGRQTGEFRLLGLAMAGMVERIEQTAARLDEQERALADLGDRAPVALVDLDAAGRVLRLNGRAARLLAVASPDDLVGRDGRDLVVPTDRARLTQALGRAMDTGTAGCNLRVVAGDREIDCRAEAVSQRDRAGRLRACRLSLVDVTGAMEVKRELEDRSGALYLLIDHLADGVLLVGASGRILACNRKLADLLRLPSDRQVGERFDLVGFWDELAVANREHFAERMRQMRAQDDLPAQERFETRAGIFQWQAVPVKDPAGGLIGRLWVVREAGPQEHARRLVSQQNRQLQILRQVNDRLCRVWTTEAVIVTVADALREGLGVDAVGFALRDGHGERRCLQLVHRGPGACLLQPHRALIDAIARDLLPRVIGGRDVALWTDLGVRASWAEAARGAGLTSLAAVALRATADAQGILWIGNRGGLRLERHQVLLIETVAPLLAARLQIAELSRHGQHADLVDPVTGLPNREQFDHVLSQRCRRPGGRCAVLVVHLGRIGSGSGSGSGQADGMLKEAADRVLASCRRSVFVSRATGPAFAILMPDADGASASALAERLVGALATLAVASEGVEAAVSIGVAASPADGPYPHDARDAALLRMEWARRCGGGVVLEGPDLAGRVAG